jgi:hypothetical protein
MSWDWDGYPNRKWLGHAPELWIGALAYAVATLLVGRLLRNGAVVGDLRFWVGLAPLLPLLLLVRGLLRTIRQQDELYRRVQLEAIAYAAGIVIVLSLMIGFLEDVGVLPHVNSMWSGQALIFSWGIAGILSRRYR